MLLLRLRCLADVHAQPRQKAQLARRLRTAAHRVERLGRIAAKLAPKPDVELLEQTVHVGAQQPLRREPRGHFAAHSPPIESRSLLRVSHFVFPLAARGRPANL